MVIRHCFGLATSNPDLIMMGATAHTLAIRITTASSTCTISSTSTTASPTSSTKAASCPHATSSTGTTTVANMTMILFLVAFVVTVVPQKAAEPRLLKTWIALTLNPPPNS